LLVVVGDVGWAAAIAFGAAVAPPDPVAAGSVLQRLGAPRRLVRVLETEGLINDGVALTLFAVAIGAVGASLSAGDVVLRLGLEVFGGIGFGLVVGFLAVRVRGWVRDVPSQVVLSLVVPYLAFVPAQFVHASGVLATVTTAVWLGTRGRGLVAPQARQQTETFWRALNTLLVGVLFVLLGVQAPAVLGAVTAYPPGEVVLASVAVVVATVVVRLGWVLLVAPLLQRLPVREEVAAHMPWRERIVLAWCGPRGAVSLAVALSIPIVTAAGEPFPRRDLLVFLTMVVVLATLVGQTVPLPWLLTLSELDELASSGAPPTGAEALRQVLELRRDHLREQASEADDSGSDTSELRLRLLEVERATLRRLYDDGEISRGTMVEISQELDLDETNVRSRARR
jgi:NhaP-type Na+/H+ or K+/H+ antiporter